MAGSADELMLLERVFLRLGSAETDEQLQNVLCKFLPPILVKLASPQEAVRKKVMELLIHINKRIKTRPTVQLPVEALLVMYQDPMATSFVINFTIIYIKSGFPRLPIEKQAELVPNILNALEDKPVSHIESLLLLIIPLLGIVRVSTDPEKISTLFGLNEKPHLTKHLLGIMLDMLLLPYSALAPQPHNTDTVQSNTNVSLPVPPGMSQVSYKRVTNNNPMTPEELEKIKLGIVKFLAHGVFKDNDILTHLIVAAADTRFGVANLADNELKKVIGTVSWDSPTITQPIFNLFLGTKNPKPELQKVAANTRIRLKLLTYMCRIMGAGFIFPASIQIIFDALHGENTNVRLKTLALNFTGNLIRDASWDSISKVATVLLYGLEKLIKEGEEAHQGRAYVIIGQLAERFPTVAFHNLPLLHMFVTNLETANPDLKMRIREGLSSLVSAYRYDLFPNEVNEDGRLDILFALMKIKLYSQDPMVRFASVLVCARIFPPNHVPSKFLLLIATGDSNEDVFNEAYKAIYNRSNVDRENESSLYNSLVTPPFNEIVKYVHSESNIYLKDESKRVTVGGGFLPFPLKTYLEILYYIRLTLLKQVESVPLSREVLKHPCEYSPKLGKYFAELYQEFDKNDKNNNSMVLYATLIRDLVVAYPVVEPLSLAIELVGCLPELHVTMSKQLPWMRDNLLTSNNEDVREYAAQLYSIVLINTLGDVNEFNTAMEHLITKSNNTQRLEAQHGAILALGYCLEASILNRKLFANELVKKCVLNLVPFLTHKNPLLKGAACTSIGLIGRVDSLSLEHGKPRKSGSPDPKRPTIEGFTKMDVVQELLEIMANVKISAKVREKTARALGLLCVGEKFPYSKEILQGFLATAKETKDVEVHFTIGESLVMVCQSVWSPEARNMWTTAREDYLPSDTTNGSLPDDNLEWLLDELLTLARHLHPNSKQASCIWLMAIIKGCGERKPITDRLQRVQNTFMEFLCENNDIIQDVASKGLCIVYDTYKSEELLTALVRQLTSGTRNVAQVSSDTKLFEEGQLGKSPTGGNLTTYKELCSLASDLNKPDLIYQFMHLANHNAIWNSKKGAAFGFSSIAEKCGEALKVHLPEIIPKLYRYQYDPTPSIQSSMRNIWRVLVPESQKMLDQYYNEILRDLLDNLNSGQYRVRQSCCLALQDFLKGTGNRSIHDATDSMEELWMKIYRVMDDHHEDTRLIAVKTYRILSSLCLRGCELNYGKAGVKLVEVILPPLLNIGIAHNVAEIRIASLQTLSELVKTSGKQLKPFLPKLIPALLQATGEAESAKLSYLSTMLGGQSQVQEAVDSARASLAKSHFTTETVSKTLQYADASILEELVPRIVELLKGSVALGTRVACAHFVVMLVVHLGKDIQPYTGKFLAVLVNGLTDRNAAIRKHYATAIGHLVATAKESSLEKLFAKLEHWYFEREDDSIRSACAHTIQSIGIHNQDILKSHSNIVLPLVFFAMHGEKTEETRNTLEVWTDIWSENSPGTETGIRQNIESICAMLKTALESPSWTVKAQAANAVSTVASKLGSTLETTHRNALISILLNGLSGRTWNGKDKLLKALASICINCKDSIKQDTEVDISSLLDVVLKETRKNEVLYKISALQSLAEILSALEIDRFEEVYDIIQATINGSNQDKDEDMSAEEVSSNRENNIKITETAYETLGKSWPEHSSHTQEKYRKMFVNHTVELLPTVTRSVQVSMVTALYNYVDKLLLLKQDNLSDTEKESLSKIVDKIIEAINYCLGISKHTRLRKETLNIVFTLATKLKEKNLQDEFVKLSKMFNEVLPNISGDNQPEIKSRVVDIKKILCN